MDDRTRRWSLGPVRRRAFLALASVTVLAASVTVVPTGSAADPCAPLINPIACENSKPGTPKATWDVSGAGTSAIQGFATDISVNRGQTVRFKVKTPARSYRLDIYRMGYYGGMGARFIESVNPSATLPQSQPACLTQASTGLFDCSNWSVSASWAVPATTVSGIYFAKLVRTDGTSGSSHIVFVVRDDASTSPVFFQTADTTWQAYNAYGGNSLYTGSPAGRAYKVSYNRPFSTRSGTPEDWVFNAEYPMVRWLEANGYDVELHDRRGQRPQRGADQEPQALHVRRPRRVLVGRSAGERRGGARRRRQPRVLQRQRGVLEDPLGERRRGRRPPDAGLLQGDARQREDRPGQSSDLDGDLA